jgi:hypothetical protein
MPEMGVVYNNQKSYNCFTGTSSLNNQISWGQMFKIIDVEVRVLLWAPSPWLWAGRLRGRSSSPSRIKNFLHIVQNGSGVHPISYPMRTGGSFPEGKADGAWSWPITSKCCRGQENVDIYIHSPIFPHINRTRLCSGSNVDLYSGGAQFESRQERWLSWLSFFVVFLSYPKKIKE